MLDIDKYLISFVFFFSIVLYVGSNRVSDVNKTRFFKSKSQNKNQ